MQHKYTIMQWSQTLNRTQIYHFRILINMIKVKLKKIIIKDDVYVIYFIFCEQTLIINAKWRRKNLKGLNQTS